MCIRDSQRIKLLIADYRVIEDMIAVIMLFNLLAQLCSPGSRLFQVLFAHRYLNLPSLKGDRGTFLLSPEFALAR